MHWLAGVVLGFGLGVAAMAILGPARDRYRSWQERRTAEIEFKLADDQAPIDKPREPGTTRISKIDYARQTPVRRIVREYRNLD